MWLCSTNEITQFATCQRFSFSHRIDYYQPTCRTHHNILTRRKKLSAKSFCLHAVKLRFFPAHYCTSFEPHFLLIFISFIRVYCMAEEQNRWKLFDKGHYYFVVFLTVENFKINVCRTFPTSASICFSGFIAHISVGQIINQVGKMAWKVNSRRQGHGM